MTANIKATNSKARAIVHMLVVRERKAKRYLAKARQAQASSCSIDTLTAASIEAHNAAELGRRILYRD